MQVFKNFMPFVIFLIQTAFCNMLCFIKSTVIQEQNKNYILLNSRFHSIYTYTFKVYWDIEKQSEEWKLLTEWKRELGTICQVHLYLFSLQLIPLIFFQSSLLENLICASLKLCRLLPYLSKITKSYVSFSLF